MSNTAFVHYRIWSVKKVYDTWCVFVLQSYEVSERQKTGDIATMKYARKTGENYIEKTSLEAVGARRNPMIGGDAHSIE